MQTSCKKMESLKFENLKFYCQFCLKHQTFEDFKMPISRKMKQNFMEITQRKLTTSIFSDFICCHPCIDQFNEYADYRAKLIKNQEVLMKLAKCKTIQKEIEEEEVLETDKNLQLVQVQEYENHFDIIEEILEEEKVANEPVEEKIVNQSVEEQEEEYEVIEEFLDEEHLNEEDEWEEVQISTTNPDEELDSSKKNYKRKRLEEPIKCPKCSRLFYYKSYFSFHFNDVHSKDRCEVCQYCGKVFKNARRLNSHILSHNIGKKRYTCDICDKSFNFSGDLLRHKRIHQNERPYKCPFENCEKSFAQSYALKLHIDVHNQVKYECDKCGAQYSVKTSLKSHMNKCMNAASDFQPVNSRRRKSKAKKDRFKCCMEGCNREFATRKYIGVHLEQFHKVKYENFEKTCIDCHESFDNIGDYARHVKIHTCTFVCEWCKIRFRTEEKLKNHIEKVHKEGDDRPYECDDCGARFKRPEHLKGHKLYRHTTEKNIACEICPLKFRQKGELKVHMRVHQDLKPFSCWQCDHECKTSSNLRQHMRLVHDGEINIYFCDICKATFKYNFELTKHKKDHGSVDALTSGTIETSTIYEIVEINQIA